MVPPRPPALCRRRDTGVSGWMHSAREFLVSIITGRLDNGADMLDRLPEGVADRLVRFARRPRFAAGEVRSKGGGAVRRACVPPFPPKRRTSGVSSRNRDPGLESLTLKSKEAGD
jgi:hypothetical protein